MSEQANDKSQEPETPMWLPALGVALFAVLAVGWLVTSKSEPAAAGSAPSATASAAASAK